MMLPLLLSSSACAGDGSDTKPALGPQLIEAARSGDRDEVRSLLERGAEVDARRRTARPR